jgi:carbamoyltransferase
VKDIAFVGFYDKPVLKFERILETYLGVAPRGFRSFLLAGPLWIKDKLYIDRSLKKALGYDGEILYSEHHESHAASAFYPSPFESAAILTMDGVGEWATASIGLGRGSEIEILDELQWPDSLGLLYSAFTYYTGFKVNSGEYKVMGLAPYGEPKYVDLIYKELLDLKEDGSFRLNQKYFNYLTGLTMVNGEFDRLFGGPPRQPESKLTQKENGPRAIGAGRLRRDHAAHGADRTRAHRDPTTCAWPAVSRSTASATAGLLREGPFKQIWIQPAAGDAGGALGVAQLIHYRHCKQPRTVVPGRMR